MHEELNDIQQAVSRQFGSQSHRYARGHILENVDDVRAALREFQLPATADVLDVATGAGFTGLFLAEQGHRVVFSDLTAAMLERTREAVEARGISAEFRQHPAEQLPYSDDRFDLVTCRVAPHHFSSPAQFVGEVARVLKPSGHFLLIDGTVPDGHDEAEAWLHRVERLRDPSHHRFVTPSEWLTMCAESDLQVITSRVEPRKQPDLEWYFETANTPQPNRDEVRKLVDNAPKSAIELFAISEEDGKIIWWWPMLTLVAAKSSPNLVL